MSIYDEIKAERENQDKKWGGPSHDDEHTKDDWFYFVYAQAHRAVDSGQDFRQQMIRVAALAIAAIESYDRIHNEKNK